MTIFSYFSPALSQSWALQHYYSTINSRCLSLGVWATIDSLQPLSQWLQNFDFDQPPHWRAPGYSMSPVFFLWGHPIMWNSIETSNKHLFGIANTLLSFCDSMYVTTKSCYDVIFNSFQGNFFKSFWISFIIWWCLNWVVNYAIMEVHRFCLIYQAL